MGKLAVGCINMGFDRVLRLGFGGFLGCFLLVKLGV